MLFFIIIVSSKEIVDFFSVANPQTTQKYTVRYEIRTCNQLVHSAYEMASTINFDWLTTSLFVTRIFTPRYIVVYTDTKNFWVLTRTRTVFLFFKCF